MKKEDIKELMQYFDEININKIKIKQNDFEIELEKYKDASEIIAKPCNAPSTVVAPQNEINNVISQPTITNIPKDTINAPMVGTFYMAPNPGAENFVKVGDMVSKGSVVGIIEAMKIMNEIEAEFDCRIVENLVQSGQPVEFGMPLFVVEKI